MPGADTAEYVEDNGAEPDEVLEELSPLEQPDDAAESEPGETTDSVESPFAGKPLEEVAKDPVVEQIIRDREARLNESYRQKGEQEARAVQAYWEEEAFKQRQTNADQVRNGYALNSLNALAKQALERGVDIPQAELAKISRALSNAAFHEQQVAVSTFQRQLVIEAVPDYRPSPAIVGNLEQATRSGDPKAIAGVNTQMMFEASMAYVWPHALQEAWKYMQEQNTVAGVKNAAATRANRSGTPTPVGATRPARGADNDAVLSSPTSTPSQRESAFRSKYGFAPP